jgi:small subunit ribosomal protein S17
MAMQNSRRRLTGVVTSNKMDKTVVVRVDRTYRHPLYGKVVRSNKRFMAHDEHNDCQIGDTVILVESRPLSRHKRWAVQEIVREDVSARTTEVAELVAVPEELTDADDGEDETGADEPVSEESADAESEVEPEEES